ncbi:hypothetical protein [Actinomycetospora atypica]|uniref:Secreted protein n=1 Tax=Actinomycetospora atypica TaxID=1290095 RepID=A0ABV9YLW5_9PSEU
MLRKTVLATAIIGAGLGSMSGAAFAHDHHDGGAAKGCSNAIAAESENGSGRSLGDTTGGDQDLDASNFCNILNGNEVLSDNNAALGGTITNGDTTDITETSTETTTETSDTTVPAPPAGGGAGGGLPDLGGLLGGLFG